MGEKLPRGHKTTDHLRVLKTSNPSFGTLAPGDRPNRAEHSFQPQRRYAAMAWADKGAKGAKDMVHLEVLDRKSVV